MMEGRLVWQQKHEKKNTKERKTEEKENTRIRVDQA